jgi:hypothetical protein
LIPSIPQGPDGWRQVVKDWEYADPNRSLLPLWDWKDSWLKDSKQSQKYHNWRMIAIEFIEE